MNRSRHRTLTSTAVRAAAAAGAAIALSVGGAVSASAAEQEAAAPAAASAPAAAGGAALAPASSGSPTAPTGVEQAAVDQTNAKRASVGCPPVTVDDTLTAAARDHAQEMVREHYFAHTSPSRETAFDRAKRFGVTWDDHIGENIELGAEDDGAAAIDGFWDETPPDDGHRRAIADCSYTRVGIGYDPGQALPDYSVGTWVQLLAT